MVETVAEVMTRDPKTIPISSTAEQAARIMSDNDIGDVLLTGEGALDGKITGIVTDRDLVVRGAARGENLAKCSLTKLASTNMQWLSPEDSIDLAVEKMREGNLRRLPVVNEQQEAVGMVSLGDLAEERDPHSVLGEISQAPANH